MHLSPYGVDLDSEHEDYLLTENKSLWNSRKHSLPLNYHGLEISYFVGGHGHYNFGDSRNSISQEESDGYVRKNAAFDSLTVEEVWLL